MNTKKMVLVSAFVSMFLVIDCANAGGLLADVYGAVTGDHEGAERMDDAHRDFKNANPDYAEAETNLTNNVRKATGQKPLCQNPLFDRRGNEVGCGD